MSRFSMCLGDVPVVVESVGYRHERVSIGELVDVVIPAHLPLIVVSSNGLAIEDLSHSESTRLCDINAWASNISIVSVLLTSVIVV